MLPAGESAEGANCAAISMFRHRPSSAQPSSRKDSRALHGDRPCTGLVDGAWLRWSGSGALCDAAAGCWAVGYLNRAERPRLSAAAWAALRASTASSRRRWISAGVGKAGATWAAVDGGAGASLGGTAALAGCAGGRWAAARCIQLRESSGESSPSYFSSSPCSVCLPVCRACAGLRLGPCLLRLLRSTGDLGADCRGSSRFAKGRNDEDTCGARPRSSRPACAPVSGVWPGAVSRPRRVSWRFAGLRAGLGCAAAWDLTRLASESTVR